MNYARCVGADPTNLKRGRCTPPFYPPRQWGNICPLVEIHHFKQRHAAADQAPSLSLFMQTCRSRINCNDRTNMQDGAVKGCGRTKHFRKLTG